MKIQIKIERKAESVTGRPWAGSCITCKGVGRTPVIYHRRCFNLIEAVAWSVGHRRAHRKGFL